MQESWRQNEAAMDSKSLGRHWFWMRGGHML